MATGSHDAAINYFRFSVLVTLRIETPIILHFTATLLKPLDITVFSDLYVHRMMSLPLRGQ
jgi:hypothetical protein